MTIVVDASAVLSAWLDNGPEGQWATELLASEPLVAPQHLKAEVASGLRRAVLAGSLSVDVATAAHDELLLLQVDLVPYEPLARRIWELRATVTVYDAWYVALAESLGTPCATLDRRLAGAPGPRCTFLLPPALG